MGPEQKITARIVGYLKQLQAEKHPVWFLKVAGGSYQRPGIPDLLIVIDGMALFLEVKAPGNKPTPLQETEIKRIQAAHALAYVVYNFDDAKTWIDRLLKEFSRCSL